MFDSISSGNFEKIAVNLGIWVWRKSNSGNQSTSRGVFVKVGIENREIKS